MKERSRTEYSIINISTGIVGYVINTIIGFICRMVFTRCLTADYLGVNGLFSQVISILSLSELGFGSAITYALYKPIAEKNTETIKSLMRIYKYVYIIVGSIIIIVGLCLLPFIPLFTNNAPNIEENFYIIYIFYLFSTAVSYFFSYKSALINAYQMNYIVTIVGYIQSVLQCVFQIFILLKFRSYYGYLTIQVIGIILYNIIISIIANRQFPYLKEKNIKKLPKSISRKLINNTRYAFVKKIASICVNNTDNLIISYFQGLITMGQASNYTLLSTTLNTILTQIFNGINSSVGNLNALSSKSKSLQIFNILNFWNLWIFGWGAIGIAVVSNDLIALLFGNTYVLPISISVIIAINFYMVGMQNAVWIYESTLGLFKQGRYISFFTALLNLILSIFLGSYFGLFGIYVATAISRLLTNWWYEPYKLFKYGFEGITSFHFFKRCIFFTFLITISGIICFFICNIIQYNLIIKILFDLMICSIVPNLIFFVFYKKSYEFNYIIKKIGNFISYFK